MRIMLATVPIIVATSGAQVASTVVVLATSHLLLMAVTHHYNYHLLLKLLTMITECEYEGSILNCVAT